uniref:Putative secreted peptide n=1 Tax=Anopheles braziliensis TaxID=58242 RepID=A0A2M3ZTC6_9DIPT
MAPIGLLLFILFASRARLRKDGIGGDAASGVFFTGLPRLLYNFSLDHWRTACCCCVSCCNIGEIVALVDGDRFFATLTNNHTTYTHHTSLMRFFPGWKIDNRVI